MNTIIFIGLGIYGLFSLIFFFFFMKNNYDFKMTIRELKVRFFSCCMDKETVANKLGEEKAKLIQNELAEIEDCNAPTGFPFNICFSKDLEKEEMVLREKLLTVLKNRENKRQDGNVQKLVIPLEATLFLTKSLNPLVNEYGEIQIISKHKKLSEQLEEIMIALKDKNNNPEAVLYKDEEELLIAIKSLLEDLKEDSLLNEQEFENLPTVKEAKTIIEEKSSQKYYSEEEINDFLPEQMFFPPEESFKEEKKKEPIKKEEKNISPFSDSPFDNESPFGSEELDFSTFEDQINMEIDTDLSDILAAELGDIELEEENNNEDIPSFYKNLTYKTQTGIPQLDVETLESSIKKLFANEGAISAFFRNLAKTKPLVFNENKEVIFADQNNVFFAIAKIYGMDSKKYLEMFKSLKLKHINEINKAISDSLEMYISDLLTGNKNVHKFAIEKDSSLFSSFGLVFQTRAFHRGLNQNEFDFFRSFPYNNEYKLKTNTEAGKELPKLVTDIYSVEIK